MSQIKAIETRYAGCRFRSRLEARWAIFFDRLDVEWEYEPEGFETSAGWYLPDFHLPRLGGWVEVKGGSFTQRDRARAAAFGAAKWAECGEKFRVLQGDVPRPGTRPILPFPPRWGGPQEIPGVFVLSLVHPYELAAARADPETMEVDGRCLPGPSEWRRAPWTVGGWTFENVDAALAAARSARFEHGEGAGAR